MATPSASTPLGRERVADQIIGKLRSQIADGTFERGSKLPSERELAASYGVSAPTVREALRALSAMRLVEVRHGSGAYVATSSDGLLDGALAMLVRLESVSVPDLLGLLKVLDLYVAELAVDHADDGDVRRVVVAAAATAQATTGDQVNRAVVEFLTAFVACAHQPLLDALCSFLVRLVIEAEISAQAGRPPRYWRRWSRETSPYRVAVADALVTRDLEQLTVAVRGFHAHIKERILDVPGLADLRISDLGIDVLPS